ncbi:dihydrofolate reductase family protein [Georgenia deserti]|uniref:Dihydrofolate reductase family protein n=1 Tax=Georgenia deserti TaxID=2093781 RepID=A0ABW4L1L1_9MICO
MGRIVVTEFVSLDGVAEAPGGEPFRHPSWSLRFDRGDDGEQFKTDEALGAAALLLGRRTYESFAGAWPHMDGPLAEKYNSMPKFVISQTLTEPTWHNTTVLSDGAIPGAAQLRERVDGEIQVPGSLTLVPDLLDHDIVDEIRLMTFPVLLGTGRRLFGEMSDLTAWQLTDSRVVGDGVLLTVYRRRHR